MKLLSVRFLTPVLIGVLIIANFSSIAQKQNADIRYMHQEVIDDPYVPMLTEDYKTSPAYRYRSSNIFTTQVNVNADGENILGDAANEPSIAVDPTNLNRIVIGWRQFDNVVSNFRQAGYGYSTDAGQTWTVPEPIEAGIARSDPVLDVDNNGNFYYNSLDFGTGSYWCDVFKTYNNSFEWDDGTFAYGGDKQWMHIDKTGGLGDGNIYEFWNSSFSICPPGSYTRSTDGGISYEDCDGIPGDPYWGTLTTGPDGEMYTVGAASNSGVVVTKSTTAQDSTVQTGWDFSNTVDLDGYLTGWSNINPGGLLGQAWIDVDRSDGPGGGYVYVLASVDRFNSEDPGDVMFARSTDGGQTWGNPIRINTDTDADPNAFQWFGTMSVAPNGRIDVIWLDTRDAVGNPYFSALYYSYSIDQGVTWSENEKLSESFNPHLGWPNQNKMGDYFDMVSDDNGAHLAWANTINGEQDVYYSYINPWFVDIDDKVENDKLFSFIVYPNPAGSKTTFRYELQKSNLVNITIYDIYGNTVKVVTDELYNAGIHNIVFNASELARGIYFCKLTAGAKSETIKLTLIN